MTEFKTWRDTFTIFGLGDGLAKSVPGWQHYSIDGVEVRQKQFEDTQAATFKSKPLASSCSRKFWPRGIGPEQPNDTKQVCLRPKGHKGDHSVMATLAGHNLGGYSHKWVYLLETNQAQCSCGLTESAEVFEQTRGMKIDELPFKQNSLVPCLPCKSLDLPDHPIGVVCPARAKQANAIDWPRM